MELGATKAVDTDAVVQCFDRALPEVYDYLLHRCRHRATAEDLTSETFLAAVSELRRGAAPIVTVAWLIGIARHKLVDHWRRLEREQRRLESVAAADETDEYLDHLDPGLGMEVLAMLNPMQTAALTLRHVDGLAVPEVARLIGRSVHATETLLARARAAFRTKYQTAKELQP